MHVWDCLSDCYVVYLWYEAGSTGLFAAGCLFLLLSTMLTGATATALVGRFGYSRNVQRLCLALAPLNAHRRVSLALRDPHVGAGDAFPQLSTLVLTCVGTLSRSMVFGFLALREVGEERTAYSQYTYLKGMHGGLQSVPLAIMTGVVSARNDISSSRRAARTHALSNTLAAGLAHRWRKA